MPRVPSTKEVIPGASVNIVLKADQRTGREVQGTIANVLTRGNHPRGIKVRLSDGRVGRVQSMMAGTFTATTPTPNAKFSNQVTSTPEVPSQIIGLDAYVKQGNRKQKPKRNGGGASTQSINTHSEALRTSAEVVSCPVCGEFTGDEAAVAHHVASHFGD